MNENAAKLGKLRKEIESCSEKEAADIVEAAQKAADEAISAAEKEARSAGKHSSRRTLDKFREDERRRVSEKRFSESRRVLLYRTQLADELFSRVEAEIKAETQKAGYRDYLVRSVSAAEAYSTIENAEVYCMERDVPVMEDILSGRNVRISVSDSIIFGGIIVKIPEKSILVDLTLDAALEKEREQFSASKEMQL